MLLPGSRSDSSGSDDGLAPDGVGVQAAVDRHQRARPVGSEAEAERDPRERRQAHDHE
jgi:hypothetical protein